MISIKFSHRYMKMPKTVNTNMTYLIDVAVVYLENLPKCFLSFDTIYEDGGIKYYQLPQKGKYLMLVLFTEYGGMWATLRSYKDEKADYYRRHLNEEVKIKIGPEAQEGWYATA